MSRIPDFPGESGPCSGSPDNSGMCGRHTLRPIERIVWVLSSHFTLARWFFRAQTVAELLSWDEVAYSMLSCWSPSSFRNVDQYEYGERAVPCKSEYSRRMTFVRIQPNYKILYPHGKWQHSFRHPRILSLKISLWKSFPNLVEFNCVCKKYLSYSKVLAFQLRIVDGS